MFFTNIRELSTKTSKLIKRARDGEDIIVTFRGKPCARISAFFEEELEDFILNHPEFLKKLSKAYQEGKEKGKDFHKFIESLGLSGESI